MSFTNSPIQSGVITIPIIPEILALKIAAGIFPLAIETITTDDDTVEGNAAKKKKASHMISCSCVCNNGKILKQLKEKLKMLMFALTDAISSF